MANKKTVKAKGKATGTAKAAGAAPAKVASAAKPASGGNPSGGNPSGGNLSGGNPSGANPALDAAIALYEDIAREYVAAVEETGVTFAPRNEERAEARELLAQLEAAGARVRNGGASVVLGAISPACVACTGDCLSQTLEISNNCHRDCYFCFNPNQEDFAYYCEHMYPWRSQLDRLAAKGKPYTAVALTGGEPMLYPEETYAFFRRARKLFPDAHLRLYTSGDMLDAEKLTALRDAGLTEIRFSVKQEDPPRVQERVLSIMALAKEFIPCVMVEMPIIPGTEEEMHILLRRFDQIGVYSVNLLEFAYPLWNWEAFAARGFTLKNPPFDVMYDYVYAGSLAVEGSEELCLRLMLWAHAKGLALGMHYCSLENKHRSQIRQLNSGFAMANPAYAFDFGDYFLKTIQVFGADRSPVRGALRLLGCKDMVEDVEAQSLSFNPKWLPRLRHICASTGVAPRFCVSTNVMVEKNGVSMIRELKVVEIDPGDDHPVQTEDVTRASDEAAGYVLAYD